MSVIKYSAEDLYESAMGHMNQGNREVAVMQLQQAILKKPDYAQAYNNRANILLQLGNHFDAVLNYDKAIEIDPVAGEYRNNRGAAYVELGEYQKALDNYGKAIELKPLFEHAWMNTGNVYRILDRTAEARVAYDRAVEINPDYVDAHLNLSFNALEAGDFKVGWREFEWRWKSGQLPLRGLKLQEWRGEKLQPDEGLLLYAEQGFGDALQFARYAPIVKKLYGGKVYLEVRQSLKRIIETIPDFDGVVTYGDNIPEGVKYCAPVMSCPFILGTTLETIPSPEGYFKPNADRAAKFDEDLAKLPPGPRIGICWAGHNRIGNLGASAIDRRRSTNLATFAPLARIQGIGWVSLQKGPPADEVKTPPRGMTILDCMENCDDFYDTAALASKLDLVISVDTAVVHLTAGSGVPTWILSRRDACWRWLGARRDSPWYDAVTHFRMDEPNDWEGLIKKVETQLTHWLSLRQKQAA